MKMHLIALFLISIYSFSNATCANAQTLAEHAKAGDNELGKENYSAAIPHYVAALSLDSSNNDFTTAYNLGLSYENIKDYKNSIQAYKDAFLKGYLNENQVLNKLQTNADKLSCPECLIPIYLEIATKRLEQRVLMNEKLFYLYSTKNEIEKALECSKVVLSEQPDNFLILKNTGMIYNHLNQTDRAVEFLEKANAFKEDDNSINKTLGMLYYNLCEDKKAAEIRKYEKLAQKTGGAHNTMIRNLQNYSREYYPKALKHLQSANAELNDDSITKLIARIQKALDVYKK